MVILSRWLLWMLLHKVHWSRMARLLLSSTERVSADQLVSNTFSPSLDKTTLTCRGSYCTRSIFCWLQSHPPGPSWLVQVLQARQLPIQFSTTGWQYTWSPEIFQHWRDHPHWLFNGWHACNTLCFDASCQCYWACVNQPYWYWGLEGSWR